MTTEHLEKGFHSFMLKCEEQMLLQLKEEGFSLLQPFVLILEIQELHISSCVPQVAHPHRLILYNPTAVLRLRGRQLLIDLLVKTLRFEEAKFKEFDFSFKPGGSW